VNFRRWNENGNTLPLVLAFASIGMIIVTVYLTHQVQSNTRALRSPAALQATLNARSGIYRALEKLISGNESDTMETISAIDQIFRMDLFDNIDTDFQELLDIDTTETVFLYTNDSVNTANITIDSQNIYSLITSRASALNITRTVEARLGCSAPAKPDTVLILENKLPVNGRFKGKVHQTVKSIDTMSSKSVERRINAFIAGLKRQSIVGGEDTSSFEAPLVIRSTGDLAAIPDTVKSHLMLDGAFSNIVWKDKRKITVYGDLQVTGFFEVENLEFSVSGETRILDDVSLANVSIFSARRIFIGDKAVFHGDAMTLGTINIYGSAEVKGRSLFIAAGSGAAVSSSKGKASRYSILLSENSVFDGVVVALGSPGGIKTDPDTKLRGILWAEKAVCHRGSLAGIIRAEYLLDCSNPVNDTISPSKITENLFSGAIEPLLSVGNYKMPYFMGVPQIISWREF